MTWLKCLRGPELTASQRHHPEVLFFETLEERPSEEGPHDLSWLPLHLMIEDLDGRCWWGECQGLRWLRGDEYDLLTPPRTILWSQVKAICVLSELADDLRRLVELRRNSPQLGIRKIFSEPNLRLELSDGSLVHPGDLQFI